MSSDEEYCKEALNQIVDLWPKSRNGAVIVGSPPIVSEQLRPLLANEFNPGELAIAFPGPALILAVNHAGAETVIDVHDATNYPWRARFVNVHENASGWRLASLAPLCPVCFGTGTNEGETCVICYGKGWGAG